MMSLQEYRTKSASLADFLPWVALVGPGVVLNKDGSFQRTARFRGPDLDSATRSEEHTSELQSLMRTSYAVFCLKKKNKNTKYIQRAYILLSTTNTRDTETKSKGQR